jgi:hypothetical protein
MDVTRGSEEGARLVRARERGSEDSASALQPERTRRRAVGCEMKEGGTAAPERERRCERRKASSERALTLDEHGKFLHQPLTALLKEMALSRLTVPRPIRVGTGGWPAGCRTPPPVNSPQCKDAQPARPTRADWGRAVGSRGPRNRR